VQVDEDTGREQLLTSFAPTQGEPWDAPWRGRRETAQTLEKGAAHDGAAGPFHDVLEIHYQPVACADFGSELEQYAPNIGMVRRVTTTLAGPQTYDLIYAHVGSIQIDMTPHAAFSVSFQRLWPPDFTAILRLHTNSPSPLTLNFASAQEFDAVLLDDTGKVVWKWSDGKVFRLAEHERTVSGEWAVPIQIPGPLLAAGKYTLHAWLTTTGPAPMFAATLPVDLSRDSAQ
jgi:hypothetical protein